MTRSATKVIFIGWVLALCDIASAQDLTRGKASFDSICAVCHGAKGEGGVGLPLRNISERLTVEETIEKIKNPNPAMPKLYPEVLSEEDVTNVAAFIRTLK
jgi:ubiquinol-cytochrome c reductase cytochrome c subunit